MSDNPSEQSTGAPPVAGAGDTAGDAPREWEISSQWRVAWRTLKWSVYGALILAGLVTAGQIFTFFEMFARVHPALGWGFLLGAIFLVFRIIVMPVAAYLRMPEAMRPPDVDLSASDVTPSQIAKPLAFDEDYLKRLKANPLLADRLGDIGAAFSKISVLKNEPALTAAELAAFEDDSIEPLLDVLDEKAHAEIRREAVAVGAATAVSMNGSIDAFVVLWRNLNLVSRVARIYYGRPNLRLSLMIFRDVATAVLLSSALEEVTTAAGDALGGLITKLGGMVVAPIMDGSINALMTLKLGLLARRRCRGFEPWSERSIARALGDVFEQVRAESTSLISELMKAVGGVGGMFAGAAEAALSAPRSAWSLVQDVFVRKPADG